MESLLLSPVASQYGPVGVMFLLLASVFGAAMTGRIVPKSQLDYREELREKAAEAAENWRAAYEGERRRVDELMSIVADVVGGETATTRLVEVLRKKAGDAAPSARGTE